MLLVEALCALLVEVGLLLSWGVVLAVLEAEARGTAPADWRSAGDGRDSSAGLIAAAATGGGAAESCSAVVLFAAAAQSIPLKLAAR